MNRLRPAFRTLAPTVAALGALSISLLAGCSDDDKPTEPGIMTHDPDAATVVSVDRFSDTAATLMKRSENPGLPAANAPIDYDAGEPFRTMGLGPDGQMVRYYNFDVQPLAPAPIYVFFRAGASTPLAGQLNVIGVIPGDAGYNDFWRVNKVIVPDDYVANEIANVAEITARGYEVQATSTIVNCPVVPDGSTASLRYQSTDNGLTRGWYDEKIVKYFNFSEHALEMTGGGQVPVSEIRVTFNINPNEAGGGPPSGFKAETGTMQTHNVLQTLPADMAYSPLWDVDVYDNADFAMVHNWDTALGTNLLGEGVALVNCPVVSVGSRHPVDPDTAPQVSVDRFSDDAGTLFRRSENASLPAANAPIDFDSGAPFLTRGLGPNGASIQYYNFDVQPTGPAPIFVLVRDGESDPVDGQLNIIDVLPGDAGYNDFWRVSFVTVPSGYVANTITSYEQIAREGYPRQVTDVIVNCPVVPDGSTASLRFTDESTELHRGWKDGRVVKYFTFSEDDIMATGQGMVPLADILVSFNINPGETGGGPPSGFKTETGSDQTHNVVAVLPGMPGYSPLWDVDIYDNADFDGVHDWTSATMANVLATGAAVVNCPVVTVSR
ncbi:MAG: hypothetical protein KC729_13110 [Candidatus Eisenbacteria bacterium]|uniref:LruC domain-containing protein n=1 Tax=Eiseniibacteriota bacterium TaxID=2212470 RepID=A0A956RPH1_UNCEI|nr:hypothetical protein [Candidatus Eisenbacteria bacterium]